MYVGIYVYLHSHTIYFCDFLATLPPFHPTHTALPPLALISSHTHFIFIPVNTSLGQPCWFPYGSVHNILFYPISHSLPVSETFSLGPLELLPEGAKSPPSLLWTFPSSSCFTETWIFPEDITFTSNFLKWWLFFSPKPGHAIGPRSGTGVLLAFKVVSILPFSLGTPSCESCSHYIVPQTTFGCSYLWEPESFPSITWPFLAPGNQIKFHWANDYLSPRWIFHTFSQILTLTCWPYYVIHWKK